MLSILVTNLGTNPACLLLYDVFICAVPKGSFLHDFTSADVKTDKWPLGEYGEYSLMLVVPYLHASLPSDILDINFFFVHVFISLLLNSSERYHFDF